MIFTINNDSILYGGNYSLSAASGGRGSALGRLRQSWLAQAVWLWTDDDDDDSTGVKGPNATEVPLIADPPQRRVLADQLFTRDEQANRKRRVDAICDQYDLRGSPLELDRGDLKQIIVDDNNKLLYCYIPKVRFEGLADG